MSDNRTFDMRCVDLGAALAVAMPQNRTVVGYRLADIDPSPRPGAPIRTLGLFWTMPPNDPEVIRFPAPLEAASVQQVIEAWLAVTPYPPKPDIDGDCEKSCRVWTGPDWCHVSPFGTAMYGK